MLRRVAGGDVPDTVWPSDNIEGIPLLRLDRQAICLDTPLARWGRDVRKSRMRGTWSFYTDDYRFNRLWSRPHDVVNSGAVAVVEPNWSIYPQTPRAAALWQIFRKRWLARWWQEHGIRTWVDLHVPECYAAENLLGVPGGWRSFATRGDRAADLDAQYQRASFVAGAFGPVTFMVYGGGRQIEQLARSRGWLWLPEERDLVRAEARSRPALRAV